ncbi:UTP--glucose-1-phosphate uridylyltransferase [Planctomycetales bacterium 10988]|nr:UTP--glucose-1-phosphate uridylyltransferase [Planctomycetales bacterium 10988]
MTASSPDDLQSRFLPFAKRMQEAGMSEIAIETFKHYYSLLLQGDTGFLSDAEISPVESLPDADQFSEEYYEASEAVLSKAVTIKLNGGLGTSMGLDRAKSLLPVKENFSFLDLIAKQTLQQQVPLVLMNSFATAKDTEEALSDYIKKSPALFAFFEQHQVPKIRQDNFEPAEFSASPELTWCPPGHGDLYASLIDSGMLDKLLQDGKEYAFVSNSDNLGASLDLSILGYFAKEELPFLMEVADRTEADRKGGHLAQRKDGQLVLRESAQCPDDEKESFQNVEKYRYFNTNNLWINLPALKTFIDQSNQVVPLPMIRNSKTVNPREPSSTAVYQLETAMGAAIGVIPKAGAVRVSRTRFAPVKTTSDLLTVQSDAYTLNEAFRLEKSNPAQKGPLVQLDAQFYKLVSDFNQRFAQGPPSLKDCESLFVEGDVYFGKSVQCLGEVELKNKLPEPVSIDDKSELQGSQQWGG